MPKITSVLFDKDGCLLDFDKTWGQWTQSFLDSVSDGDMDLAQQLGALIGFEQDTGTFHPDSPVIAGTTGETIRLVLPLLPEWTFPDLLAFANERAARAELQQVVPLFPLLHDLKAQGLKLGIATNDAETTAHSHMKSLGVAGQFDLILGSDSGWGGKPEPGMQLAFLERFDLKPENSIMIGDSLHDLDAGRAAGMICVGVLTGPATLETLMPSADAVLPDIGHLPEWIATQNI